jgi:hypothetical protein
VQSCLGFDAQAAVHVVVQPMYRSVTLHVQPAHHLNDRFATDELAQLIGDEEQYNANN